MRRTSSRFRSRNRLFGAGFLDRVVRFVTVLIIVSMIGMILASALLLGVSSAP